MMIQAEYIDDERIQVVNVIKPNSATSEEVWQACRRAMQAVHGHSRVTAWKKIINPHEED